VEARKFVKNYLHFIKASQRFYRQYILNFDAQFDGIPELRKIAHKWKDDGGRNYKMGGNYTDTRQHQRRPRGSASPPH
jgi:hypothetical protein